MANKINLDTSIRLDITCRKGDTFSVDLTVEDDSGSKQSLVNNSYAMQVRTNSSLDGQNGLIITTTGSQDAIDGGSSSPIISQVSGELFTAFAYFVFDRGSSDSSNARYGTINVSVPAEEMANVPSGRYVYDLQQLDASTSQQKTLLHGSFIVNEDVSEVGGRVLR
jgi:hypothetical protein